MKNDGCIVISRQHSCALFAILSNMIQFIHTDVLPEKATKQYLLNLGISPFECQARGYRENPSSNYRRNADAPPEHNTRKNSYAHRLINIMLRQARALGWRNIDLKKWNVRTANTEDWGKLPPWLRAVSVKDLEALISSQIKNFIGKVAPRARCKTKNGEAISIPMIIEWKHNILYWNPPTLYEKDPETNKVTHFVYDFDGNKQEVVGIKQCITCGSIIEKVVGAHPQGNFGGQKVWACDFETCLIAPVSEGDETMIPKEWLDIPDKVTQKEHGGLRTISACFGPDSSAVEYLDEGWKREFVTWYKTFTESDIRHYFSIKEGPLPFLPGEWYRETAKGLVPDKSAFFHSDDRDRRADLLEFFKNAPLFTGDHLQKLYRKPAFNVQADICPYGYFTPTGELVEELELTYVSKEQVMKLQKTGGGLNSNQPDEYRFQWQDLALTKFDANGFQGMVEACTGSGKTVFCAKAIKRIRSMHEEVGDDKVCVNIVVPTVALLDQWYDFLTGDTEVGRTEGFRDQEVGRFGGSHKTDQLQGINVFVINSAAKYLQYIMRYADRPNFFDNVDYNKIPDHLHSNLEAFHQEYPHQFLIVG